MALYALIVYLPHRDVPVFIIDSSNIAELLRSGPSEPHGSRQTITQTCITQRPLCKAANPTFSPSTDGDARVEQPLK